MKTKYCRIYVVRHGETEWNIKHLLQGHSDIQLNENGYSQARSRAAELKEIPFAAAFSSDLSRAVVTAEILALEHSLTVITTHLLRERNFGKYEGVNFEYFNAELKQKLTELNALSDLQQRMEYQLSPDIEPDSAIVERFIRFLREFALAYPGKDVLAVCHSGVMRAVLTQLGFISLNDDHQTRIKNLAYFILESDGVDFFVTHSDGIEFSTPVKYDSSKVLVPNKAT